MNFYIDPAFYVFLALAVIPAAILGFTGHRIKYYGLAASLAFLLLLFGENAEGMLAFLVFLAVACAATFWVLSSWKRGEKSLWKYRCALVAVIAPLVIYKIGAVFDHNLMGFLGISYITFKAVQVIIEIRDGLIDHMDFADYLYFLVFFTPFTSGPIDRSRRFTEDARIGYIASRSMPTCSHAALCSYSSGRCTRKCSGQSSFITSPLLRREMVRGGAN